MKLRLVENEPHYWEFVRNLRNNSQVKQGFVQQDHITELEHIAYMQVHHKGYYICLADDRPAGFVGAAGVANNDIRVATHPDFQKMGIAFFMISELMQLHPAAFAKVKVDNKASLKLFEKCGFKKKYYILEKNEEL